MEGVTLSSSSYAKANRRYLISIIAICFTFWIFMSYLNFRKSIHLYLLDEEEQLVSFYSENGFYLSFYKQVVDAPSLRSAIKSIIFDDRSEYPDVINALRRFNVYQDVVTGIVWRLFIKNFTWLRRNLAFSKPINFYLITASTFQAAAPACLALFAGLLGSSFASMIGFFGFFSGLCTQELILRLSAIPLRENWTLVFIWINCMATFFLIKSKVTNNKDLLFLRESVCELLIAFSTFISLIFWQFSVFIFITQLASIYAIYLIGYPIEKTLLFHTRNFRFILWLAALVQFFPMYLVFVNLRYVAVAISLPIELYFSKKLMRNRFSGKTMAQVIGMHLKESLIKGLLSLALYVLIKILFSWFNDADTHVYDLLFLKLGLKKHNFDTAIYYMNSTEFRPFPAFMYHMMLPSKVIPVGVSMVVCVLILLATDLQSMRLSLSTLTADFELAGKDSDDLNPKQKNLRQRGLVNSKAKKLELQQATSSVEVDNSENVTDFSHDFTQRNGVPSFHPEYAYLVLQTLAFFLLTLLVTRLRILFLPLLCIFGSLAFSFVFWESLLLRILRLVKPRGERFFNQYVLTKKKKRIFKMLLYTLSVWLLASNLTRNFLKEDKFSSEATKMSKIGLSRWIKSNLNEDTAIMTTIGISGTARLATNVKLFINPQYESAKIRERSQIATAVYGCHDSYDFGEMLYRKYKISYILIYFPRCTTSFSGSQGALSVSDVVDYLDDKNYRCFNKDITQRFCYKSLLEENGFYRVFQNGDFLMLQWKNEPKAIENSIESKKSRTTKMANSFGNVDDWINRCTRTDQACPLNLCEFARAMIDRFNQIDLAKKIYAYVLHYFPDSKDALFHYAEFLDYDLGQPKGAFEFYKKSVEEEFDDPKKIIDYAAYRILELPDPDGYADTYELLSRLLPMLDDPKKMKKYIGIICKGYSICAALRKRIISTPGSRERFSELESGLENLCSALWKYAKVFEVRELCVKQIWAYVEGKALTNYQKLHAFLFS